MAVKHGHKKSKKHHHEKEKEDAVDQLHQYMLNQHNRNGNFRGSNNVNGEEQGQIKDGNFFFNHDMNKNQVEVLNQGQAIYNTNNDMKNNNILNSSPDSGSQDGDEGDGNEDADGEDGVSSFMSGG